MAHAFCTLHKIAYNDELDPTCPQCMIGRVGNVEQLSYDVQRQLPVSADGTLLDKRTLQPVK